MQNNFNIDSHLFGEQENSLTSFGDILFPKEERQDSFLLELTDDDLDQIAGGAQIIDTKIDPIQKQKVI